MLNAVPGRVAAWAPSLAHGGPRPAHRRLCAPTSTSCGQRPGQTNPQARATPLWALAPKVGARGAPAGRNARVGASVCAMRARTETTFFDNHMRTHPHANRSQNPPPEPHTPLALAQHLRHPPWHERGWTCKRDNGQRLCKHALCQWGGDASKRSGSAVRWSMYLAEAATTTTLRDEWQTWAPRNGCPRLSACPLADRPTNQPTNQTTDQSTVRPVPSGGGGSQNPWGRWRLAGAQLSPEPIDMPESIVHGIAGLHESGGTNAVAEAHLVAKAHKVAGAHGSR